MVPAVFPAVTSDAAGISQQPSRRRWSIRGIRPPTFTNPLRFATRRIGRRSPSSADAGVVEEAAAQSPTRETHEEEEEEETCSICLENKPNLVQWHSDCTTSNHKIHPAKVCQSCKDECLGRKDECPICRGRITTERNNNGFRRWEEIEESHGPLW